MTRHLQHQSQFSLKYILMGLLIGGAFSSLGFFISAYPSWQESLEEKVFDRPIDIYRLSEPEVQSYAQALYDIEQIRQKAYADVKQRIGHVPPVDCHHPKGLNKLSAPIRDITTNYCIEAMEIVKTHDLTIAQFNLITQAMQNDQIMANRIQTAFSFVMSGDCTLQ